MLAETYSLEISHHSVTVGHSPALHKSERRWLIHRLSANCNTTRNHSVFRSIELEILAIVDGSGTSSGFATKLDHTETYLSRAVETSARMTYLYRTQWSMEMGRAL